jgi:DNA polymerase-1
MNDKKRKTLYLIDGPNLAFRAFFAIGGMTNSQGLPTNALFGFTNMLLKLIRDERPDYLAITWDPKGGSFRERVYPEYKGTRPDMPGALRQQMPHFARVAEAFDVPFLCIDDFEADDVMGTLARRHEGDLDVVLITSDKDLMQLVSDHVSLFDTMKDRRISFPEVEEKFGCRPELVPDALGIWGDSSDNIPGVKGIGEKGVKALLARWKGLDDIYANIEEITPPGTRGKLETDRDNAYLSRDLATIRIDAPVDVDLDALALQYPPPEERAKELFTELEFRSLLREFGGEMATVDRSAYRLVTTEEELKVLRAALVEARRFAIDTETTSLEPLHADLVGLSFCSDASVAWYVPVAHTTGEPQLSWELVRETLAPVLTDPTIGKTGQHLKYDLKVLARHGVELAGVDGDTLIADYLVSPDRRSHKLDDLALVHLGHRMISYDDVAGDKSTFAEVALDAARDYAAEDAHVTWLLDGKLTPRLEEEDLGHLYRKLELPLIPVLARMETTGIAVDKGVLAELSVELAAGITAAQNRCFEAAGEEFNIASVKQLREVLFDKLGLPVIKKTKTGPSTNEQVLVELSLQHPLPRAILEYRSLVKLKNTYVDPLPELIEPLDQRIHTHFSQTTAATGRLASTDPNLQNIPVRTLEGRRIRRAFVAPPGRLLLAADYSQVELRVLAHLCGGEGGFADAFARAADVHAETAASLFNVASNEVTREMRSIAKAVNFGIVYGQSAFGLAQTQRISRTEAAEYIRLYKERFPEIESYRQNTLAEAAEQGFVQTLMGRRRPVPDLQSGNFAARAAAERVAINTPVQGSAADLIKKAMLAVDERLRTEFPGQQLLVRREMCSAMELTVPLVVDLGFGHNWDEAH